MKVVFFVLFSICFASLSLAQSDEVTNDTSAESENMRFERYALGYSASALVNFYSGIQLSHDIGLRPRLNLAIETAYINSSLYSKYTNGFRLKTGIQYMLGANDYVAVTAGVNHIYRVTHSPRDFTIFYFEEDYSENFTVDRWKYLNGLEATFSLIARISDRFRLELGVGFGAGYLIVNDLNSTVSRSIEDSFTMDNNFFPENTSSNTIGIGSFNVNVSYVLFKR